MNKILFITESYYPSKGGVPIVVKYLEEGLCSKGYSVSVVTAIPKHSNLIKYDECGDVSIIRFRIWRNAAKLLRGEITELQQFVLDSDFDTIVVECGQASTTDAILPVLGGIKCTKIFHSHGLSGLLPSKWFVKGVDLKHTIGHTYNKLRLKY